MKSRSSIFPGVLLITLGVLFLGEKMGWFDIDFGDIARFWPLLLILAGVNLILRRRGSAAGIVTTVLLAVAIPLAIVSAFRSHRDRIEYHVDGDYDHHDDEDDHDEEEDEDSEDVPSGTSNTLHSNRFAEPMDNSIQQASLKFGGGAGSFSIGAASDSLIEADTRVTMSSYNMTVSRDEATHTAEINLKLNDDKIKIKNDNFENRVDLKLSPKPVWNFDFGFGAGQADLDLSAYAVRKLELDAGAAEIDLKLGDRAAESLIDIESGVASVTIQVPRTVGCQVEMKGAMNSKSLEGFTETSNNVYLSPDYEKSGKKITIRYEGGMTSLKVIRY